MSFGLTSCEKNEYLNEKEIPQESSISRISLPEFNSKINQDSKYDVLKNYFEHTINSMEFSQRELNSNDNVVVLTDEILLIQKNDNYFYTFKLLAPSLNNEFYNLVVKTNSQGAILHSEIYEYLPDSEWLQNINQAYSGYIKLWDNDILAMDEIFNRGAGRCISGVTIVWTCNLGNNHYEGDPACTSGTSWTGVATINYEPCSNGPEPTVNGIYVTDNPSGNGGNGGGGSIDDTPTIPTTPCSEVNGQQTIGFVGGDGDCVDIEAYNLHLALETDPYLLLDIDCTQIQHWQTLAQHTAPQSVQNKIDNLPSSFFNNFEIQSLEEANGPVINMDYFPVNITTLPNNPNTGQQFTATQFLDYFRRNINSFVVDGGSTFEPYCEISSMCQTETDLWNSTNPLGAVVYLDIPADDGVIICTKYQSDYWYFMTMNAPYAGNHPVSGTRQFGYKQNLNGSYDFFVRGVDRINSFVQSAFIQAFTNADPYLGADLLWYAFQSNINDFVNNNGGTATIVAESKNRPNWNKVKDVLLGNSPISDLGCD